MARKIFVSYKHGDNNVKPIDGKRTTCAYVDQLIKWFEGDEIYQREGNEKLSRFKDETIESHLREKIYDSSVTLVLISPNMKDKNKNESDQWIPWEISYSLKEITRNGRTSHANAILSVVLPDKNSSYNYFFAEDTCKICHCTTPDDRKLFKILRKNMLNIKNPVFDNCLNHRREEHVYCWPHSYIPSFTWDKFEILKMALIQRAEDMKNIIDDFKITKTVDG